MMSLKFYRHLFIMAAPFIVAPHASATPITIPNASFESPISATGTGTVTGLIPGWTDSLGVGDGYGTESIASYFSSPPAGILGSDFAAIANYKLNTPSTLSSAASLGSIAASTQYTLTLAIGNISAPDTTPYGSPGPVSFSLLGNGTPLATQIVPNGTVPNGTFDNFALTYDSPNSGAVIGEDLTIQLEAMPQSTALYLAAFDNVALDASPVQIIAAPEPHVWSLSMVTLGALALCLVRRQQIS